MRETLEIWEAVTASTVFVTTTNARGQDIGRPVGGPDAPQRIRISEADRLLNIEANPEDNPFENGYLRRVDGEHVNDDTQPAKTDAQLLGMLQEAESLEDLLMEAPELQVRRLLLLAEGDAADKVSMSAHSTIKRVIATRWPPRNVPTEQSQAAISELFR